MPWAKSIAAAIALLALGITDSSAHAASTRAEYVAQVDPICQSAQAQEAAASQPLLRAIRRARHHKPNRRLTRRLRRLSAGVASQKAAIEHAANNQIATIPPAPDDVSLIQVWLRARNELIDLETGLEGGFRGKPGRVVANVFRVIGLEQETSDLVSDFGFRYCNQSSSEIESIGIAFGGASS
jgi:hypothetical protein